MKKTTLLSFSIILITIFVLGAIMNGNTAPTVVRASASDNVSGWAWSDNTGWISFNSTNCDVDGNTFIDSGVCGGDNATDPVVDYGVKIDDNSANPTYGDFSGYAWSDNVGWISFNRAETGNPPLDEGDDPGVVDGSGIARLDWSTGEVTGWARALSAMDYDSSAGPTKCPFTNRPGRRVVNFPDPLNVSAIRSNNNDENTAKSVVSAFIPAGKYDITLVTYDDDNTTQLKERWYLKFSDGASGLISMNNPSDAISDRPDSSSQIFQTVQTDFDINFDVQEITAYHAAYYEAGVANSLYPICAVFDEPNRWDGWIKLGSDTGPTSWVNEVALDIVSGSPTENQFSGYAWGSEVMGWINFDSWPGMGVRVGVANTAPTVPTVAPPDPSEATKDVNITFTLDSSDAEGDQLRYGIDWDNNKIINTLVGDEWVPASYSTDGDTKNGFSVNATHSWPSTGTYYFNVLAEDVKGAQSGWSENSITLYDPPVITSFTVIPSIITSGVPTDLTFDWATTDASSCSSDFASSIGTSGPVTESKNLTADTTFTLTCFNIIGWGVSSIVDVSVFSLCDNDDTCESGETLFNCPRDCFQVKEF